MMCISVIPDFHEWLLSKEVDLLPRILLPLAGPEEYEEDDMERLPADLQYLPDTKQREADPDVRGMLVQAIYKVCNKFQAGFYLYHYQCGNVPAVNVIAIPVFRYTGNSQNQAMHTIPKDFRHFTKWL